jgi:Rho termination factor-like protein
VSELEELTVAELREMAREQGIAVTGLNKADLIEALEAPDEGSEPDESAELEAQAPEAAHDEPDDGLIPIETRKSGRWWCPVCGHDQPTEVTTCEQCGAVREGTSVRPAGESP